FVMFWSYVAFAQYLIIWAGNLPEEIPWYLRRLSGGWGWLGAALIVLHFALPFLLLLPEGANRNPRILASVAALVVLMRFVDLYWLVRPVFTQAGAAPRADVRPLPMAREPGALFGAAVAAGNRGEPSPHAARAEARGLSASAAPAAARRRGSGPHELRLGRQDRRRRPDPNRPRDGAA